MQALILKNKVIQLEEETFPVSNDMQWMDATNDVEVGWILQNGKLQQPEEHAQDIEELIFEYECLLKSHIKTVALERNYDNALSIATFTNSTNTDWKAEAEAFVAWRDDVWAYAIEQLDLFESGGRELVTTDEFINELPVIRWPE